MLALLMSVPFLCALRIPQDGLNCKVAPPVIEVGAFYNGATVRVEGTAQAGSQVIVAVAGPDREERFNKKARFGPIWLNAGGVRVSGVPSAFLRFSTGPVPMLLNSESIGRYGLDEDCLMRQMYIEPRAPDVRSDAAIRASYLALKKSAGTYRFADGTIHLVNAGERAAFSLQFQWPKKAPPAEYEVRVYAVRDGSVIRGLSVPIEVVRTGFPAWLAGMAENQASLYGLVAVIIAALAGFGIDFLTTRLFGRKGASAH